MALKSSREGLRKELVDYLGNLIVDDNLKNEIIKVVGDNFVTIENLNNIVNNLTMQITTESGERIEADDALQNNITGEATSRGEADITLQNNINAEVTARQEAISNLEALIGSGGLQIDLLWTNVSPSSEFGPQTINLDLSQYKCVLIDIIMAVGDWRLYADKRNTIYLVNGFDGDVGYASYNDYYTYKKITVNSNSIVMAQGYFFDNTQTPVIDNRVIIPYKIYGIK